jgi:hypothetical protein
MKELIENQIVWKCGKEFIATNVRKATSPNAFGDVVWYFDGVCTDNPVNDDIRKTLYNGGSYAWLASDD